MLHRAFDRFVATSLRVILFVIMGNMRSIENYGWNVLGSMPPWFTLDTVVKLLVDADFKTMQFNDISSHLEVQAQVIHSINF